MFLIVNNVQTPVICLKAKRSSSQRFRLHKTNYKASLLMIEIYYQVLLLLSHSFGTIPSSARESCVLTEHTRLRLTNEDHNHAYKTSDTMILNLEFSSRTDKALGLFEQSRVQGHLKTQVVITG